jgi:hypothetical protein
MARLAKFLKLSGRDKGRFLEAAFWLGVYRAAILIIPFKTIAGRLGKHMAETDTAPLDAAVQRETLAVSRALRTMGRHLPWECKCLVQAAAGKRMLDRRRIPATLYLGAAKNEEKKLIAHAWLRAGDMILMGSAGMDRFTVVGAFS